MCKQLEKTVRHCFPKYYTYEPIDQTRPSGVQTLSCLTVLNNQVLSRCTHEGGTRTRRRERKLKILVFNDDKAGQDKAERQDTPGVTSRPDEIKLKRQD